MEHSHRVWLGIAATAGAAVNDYMGLESDGSEVLSLFGSTDGGGPSSIFLRRLIP
jgi:hypothetical protein